MKLLNQLLTLVFYLSFSFLSLSANTLEVTTIFDIQDFSCSDGSCSIRDAIHSANNGDTILIPGGTYTLSLGQLVIDKNLTLLGDNTPPSILDGAQASRILFVTQDSKVAIHHLVFQNGYQDDTFEELDEYWRLGAGIFNKGKLTLEDVDIQNNNNTTILGEGGGIYTWDTLIMNRCQVINNQAQGPGGGIGAINAAYLQINNSWIDSNISKEGAGGGISSIAHSLIRNTTISNNRSENIFAGDPDCSFRGGGGFFTNTNGFGTARTIIFENVTFSGNYSDNLGGAILMSSAGSANEVASNVYLINCTIINNESLFAGGGIKNCDVGNLHLFSTVIANNTAGEGGHDLDNYTPLVNNLLNLVMNCNGICPGFTLSTDPLLEGLADNGGFAPTHLPLANSPLIDAGSCIQLSNNTDQRNYNRPVDFSDEQYPNADDACDIGAVEVIESDIVATQNLNKQVNISIFPNPTPSTFYIQGISYEQINRLQVFDSFNRLVLSQAVKQASINIESLASGIYTIHFSLKTGHTISKRLIKN